jgi:hypothetical protein
MAVRVQFAKRVEALEKELGEFEGGTLESRREKAVSKAGSQLPSPAVSPVKRDTLSRADALRPADSMIPSLSTESFRSPVHAISNHDVVAALIKNSLGFSSSADNTPLSSPTKPNYRLFSSPTKSEPAPAPVRELVLFVSSAVPPCLVILTGLSGRTGARRSPS